jgi:hypothetical protein
MSDKSQTSTQPANEDDVARLAHAWVGLPPVRPSSFVSARMARVLHEKMAQGRRRARSGLSWQVALTTGLCGMAFGAWAMHAEVWPFSLLDDNEASTVVVAVSNDAQPTRNMAAVADVTDVPIVDTRIAPAGPHAAGTQPKVATSAATKKRAPAQTATALDVAQAPTPASQMTAWVTELDTPAMDVAASKLIGLARDDVDTANRILHAVGEPRTVGGQRVACQVGLLHRRNLDTLQMCQTWVQSLQQDPHALGVLLAVAVLAEELHAWDAAEQTLTDLLMHAFHRGLPRDELLFRRAAVRLEVRRVDDARDDALAGVVELNGRAPSPLARKVCDQVGVKTR